MSFTYSTLKDAVIAAAEDDGTEFASYFDTAMILVCERLNRDSDTYGLVTHTTVSAVNGQAIVTLPSDLLVFKHLTRISGTSHKEVRMRTSEFIKVYWPSRSTTGTPKYYAPWENLRILVAPTPGATTNFEVEYVRKVSVLTSTSPTNFFSTYYPNAIFKATMAEMNRFMKNWETSKIWEQDYQREMAALANESRRQRKDDTQQQRPSGGENNLLEGQS